MGGLAKLPQALFLFFGLSYAAHEICELPTCTNYISELEVSLHEEEEQHLLNRGFSKVSVDLNKGSSGNYIYIWYKLGSTPITRIQFTFTAEMANGLISAGYTKIDKDLNKGAKGDYVYLWYYRGSGEYDIPIREIDVTKDAESEAAKFSTGWERLACDLNRGARGNWIHMWVRRNKATYISDVTATESYGSDLDLFRCGYNRLDEDTNRGARGSYVFIWYRQTTDPELAITDLKVSTNDEEYQQYQQLKYTAVSVNLNQGAKGRPEYLWYKRDIGSPPIKAVSLLVNKDAFGSFNRAGITVIEKDLNTGNDGDRMYVCFSK